MENLATKAQRWVTDTPESAQKLESEYYCQTRDVLQARTDRMTIMLLQNSRIDKNHAYVIGALISEIGNNSFDHNLGAWPDIPGAFFGYDITRDQKHIVLADRGQGVFATLKKVKPELELDEEALKVAFTERISSRLPERRGNGLKYVRENIANLQLHLAFFSGNAMAELNAEMIVQKTDQNIRGCLAVLTFSDNVSK